MNAIFDGSILYSLNYKYLNQKNLLDRYKFSSGTTDFTTSFSYGDLNKGEIPETVYGVSLNNNLKLSYDYDNFARQNSRTLYTNNANITKYYTFRNGAEETSTSYVVDSVTENGYTYNYSYDALGNIISYTKTNNSNNQVVESYVYRYDNKGQLVYAGTTDTNGTEYTYDANGNILTKKNLSTNATVSYGYTDPTWADLLTSYNGQAISYDTIGNPLNYNNGSAMSFTWVDGRNLATVTKNGSSFSYSYDAESNRISKLIGDVSTQYMIFDGIMYGERKYDANGETVIYYLYDENNNKYGFVYNGKYYYYQINLQGDVIGIYDENGQLVVQYAYDVWGKPLSVTGALASTIGQINPIRYRGYYYDNETGFYYVSSRYYDPEIGRWINADGYVATGQGILGNNMFAYCGNNPVNRADPSGMFWKEIGNFFKKVGTKIADFAKATFGSGRSAYATIAKTEVEYLPDSLPITAKSGTKTTQTISKYGNSSKPISAYGKYSIDNPIESSSAGIKINIDKFTLDISVGFDNIGISTSLSNGNTTGSFGLKANLSEQKVGFEESTAIKWGNTTETTYTNVSASWWAIVAAYISVTTGQPMSRPAPRPTPSPSYAYGN